MRRTERAFFLEAIKPYLREGERVFESGTAVIYEIKFGSSFPPAENRWYLDCPSYFGSTETRQIGRVEQAPGWKEGLVCWTENSKRNALDILQAVTISQYPSVAQVLSGEYTPPPDEVVLVVFRKNEWMAVGPYPTQDIKWDKLLPTDRIFPTE